MSDVMSISQSLPWLLLREPRFLCPLRMHSMTLKARYMMPALQGLICMQDPFTGALHQALAFGPYPMCDSPHICHLAYHCQYMFRNFFAGNACSRVHSRCWEQCVRFYNIVCCLPTQARCRKQGQEFLRVLKGWISLASPVGLCYEHS